MSRLTMFIDAVRFSTAQQLAAVFEDVKVTVFKNDRHYGSVVVSATVWHRGRQYAFTKEFPVEYALDRDGEFYEHYMRKAFPRQVAREVIDSVMDAAL